MQACHSDLWVMELRAFSQLQLLASGTKLRERLESVEAVRVIAEPQVRSERKIAVIPIRGMLEARTTLFGRLFGMDSYERIGQMLDLVVSNDAYDFVILDISSPGGQVYGCPELADKIFRARSKKTIIAMCDPMAASGAYWLAAAASRVVITPSGDSGSVGVISEHIEFSKGLAMEGTTVTVIRSEKSPFKQESNPAEPLTDEALQNQQARVNAIYDRFVADLARFRGVSVDYVNDRFGKGRLVSAEMALAAKMVDRIDTMEGVLKKLGDGRYKMAAISAEDNWNAPTVKERRLGLIAKFNEAANTAAAEEN